MRTLPGYPAVSTHNSGQDGAAGWQALRTSCRIAAASLPMELEHHRVAGADRRLADDVDGFGFEGVHGRRSETDGALAARTSRRSSQRHARP